MFPRRKTGELGFDKKLSKMQNFLTCFEQFRQKVYWILTIELGKSDLHPLSADVFPSSDAESCELLVLAFINFR